MCPKILAYHGTANKDIAFRRDGGAAGIGAYFTANLEVAKDYAEMDASIDGENPIVITAYLAIKNPYYTSDHTDFQAINTARRDKLESLGFDSVIGQYPNGDIEYIAFRPEQIEIISKD